MKCKQKKLNKANDYGNINAGDDSEEINWWKHSEMMKEHFGKTTPLHSAHWTVTALMTRV